MTDESDPLDWLVRPQTWPQWTPNALWNSGLAPPPRQVPARIAVDWQESPNGGAIARPSPFWNRGDSRHWVESLLPMPPAGGNGGILGDLGAELEGPPWFNPGPELKSIMPWPAWLRPVAPESLLTGRSAPSHTLPTPPGVPMSGTGGPYAAPASEPAPPAQAPQDYPWLGRATGSSQSSILGASMPRVEHLDSARYLGAAASRANAEPMPGSDHSLSPVTQAPSWELPTRATADAARIFAESLSPPSQRASTSRIPAQRYSAEGAAETQTAPIKHAVAQEEFVEPDSDPHRDFAQAGPFGGFDSPSPVESLANQSEFYECMRSRTGTAAPMKGGYYEFCTYGRLAMTKQDPNTGEPTELLFTPGPNGNEVYGRDRITGAWGRWTLAPGQTLTATTDEDGNFHMSIR